MIDILEDEDIKGRGKYKLQRKGRIVWFGQLWLYNVWKQIVYEDFRKVY